MKFIIILAAALGLACSTASKNKSAGASSQPTSMNSSTTMAQSNQSGAAMEDQHHHHHHHHKKSDESAPADKGGGTTCTSGSDERTIAVEKTDSGCTVNYTKSGKTDAVATGNANMDHCNDVAGKIRKNLEGAGFTCK